MKVLVLGAGELASCTAHRLFRAGFTVVMTEISEPLAVRRAVSFCSAVWDNEIVVEGVCGRLWKSGQQLPDSLDHIAVVVDPEAGILPTWRPEVLVDARLLKCSGATSVTQAPLVISLGPGAVCGVDAHFVVETNRGHDLGRLLENGSAAPDTGVPGAMAGITTGRVLRAPCAGKVRGGRPIGELLQAGDLVAWVDENPVRTGVPGVLRGILHDGLQVTQNIKLGDVDPRGEVSACFTLSDKGRTISGAVLEAIMCRFRLINR